MADGCGFDAEGNLWVTLMAANRIVAITPELEVVTVIDDPGATVMQAPSSVVWGGDDHRDLYIGSLFGTHVVKTRTTVPGMASLAGDDGRYGVMPAASAIARNSSGMWEPIGAYASSVMPAASNSANRVWSSAAVPVVVNCAR